ncbi:MAG: radical SAM protein [Deltaproteobacteria bacterium]|nr:radical SAM protein [Deltaproteobacteria bacterium]
MQKDWGGRISVALAYPNVYRIGMSNLGFQVVYALLNRRQDVVAERFFLPDVQEMSPTGDSGKGLVSVESLSPLQKFDLVAFSLSFENDYSNILKILQLGKIPLLSRERTDFHPLIAAGGINTFLNPEPLAAFFDFFLLGEAEGIFDSFMDLFRDLKRFNTDRREIIKIMAREASSLYVPSFYSIEYYDNGLIKSRHVIDPSIPESIPVSRLDLDTLPVRRSTILTRDTEFSGKVLVELARGCGRSCRFCAAGYVYRPPRFHDEGVLSSMIEEILEEGHPLGLLSACVSDVPGIENLTGLIVERGGRYSVSSLRADSLTQDMATHLWEAGQRSIAIAPEAGSERLRRVINKHLTQKQIIDAVKMIAKTGDFSLRLYFMIGLPTETREDVEEIVSLVKKIKHHMVKESSTRGKIRQIKLSVNCFIPKPFTPFQWFPMEDLSSLKDKQRRLKKALSREGGVKVSFDVSKWAYIQTLLSVGDRRVSSLLLALHENDGDWTKTFRNRDLNPDFYVYRRKSFREILPWDFIDHGIRREHLIKESMLALRAEESETCRVGECTRCGVCGQRNKDELSLHKALSGGEEL